MTGSATFARDVDVATTARERLDRVASSASAVEVARRQLLADLLALWPTSAWIAAGATSAKRWIVTYTHYGEQEAHRLERLAGLCHRHEAFADAVMGGVVSLARADVLGTAANPDREPWLADSLPAFLRLAGRGCDDAGWGSAVRHWASLVDQEREVRQIPAHSIVLSQRLFGGGEIHGDLSPNAFLNVAMALDAWTDDPDPRDGAYQRSLGERRADALDDICRASLDPDSIRWGASRGDEGDDEWEEDAEANDTFDGFCPTDNLDEQLAATDDVDALLLLRRRLRRAEAHRRRRARRRTRSRSGACVNVHIDLRTLADLREIEDLEDLVLRGDGWNLTLAAVEQLLCDSALTAVLFDGKGTLLDANDAAEQWSRKQRRTIAARDGGCVFPGCGRPPRHCDMCLPRSGGHRLMVGFVFDRGAIAQG